MLIHANPLLIVLAVAIGAMVGAVGVGGMFLPPALTLVTGMDLHQSTAMSLLSFVFTGIAGACYSHGKGSLDWRAARPLCLGAALTGWVGAWISHHVGTAVLSLLLAVAILGAGLFALNAGGRAVLPMPAGVRQRWLLLAAFGAVTGLLSGLTGVGGPVLSVPLMVMCGFPVLTAVGAGQALQVVGAVSGSLVNLHYVGIDYQFTVFIAGFEIVGVLLGAFAIRRVEDVLVRRLAGGVCLVAGCSFILHAW